MVTYKDGDLLTSGAKLIGHQTNCMGVMGGGVALTIREKWPEVYEQYQKHCAIYRANPAALLGTALPTPTRNFGPIILNLFGQCGCGTGRQTNYLALSGALKSAAAYMEAHGFSTLALPYKIGCGLAGGEWDVVRDAIHGTFDCRKDVNVEIWKI